MNSEIKSRIMFNSEVLYEEISIFEEFHEEAGVPEEPVQFGEYYLTRITAVPTTFVVVGSSP
ncbi:MAG: hypothetical protein JRN10_02160 [Nitrososphaerota archaeon]|nr:hypothetical protein [Nitrososphaerota archaeon]